MLAMTPEQQRSWEEDGLIIIEDFFTAPELGHLQQAVDSVGDVWRETTNSGVDAPFAVRNVVAHHDAFLDLVDHPRILPLVVDAIGPNIQLRTSHLDYRPPYAEDVQQELRANLHADPSKNGVAGANNVSWHPDLAGLFLTASHDGIIPFMEVKVFYTLSDMRQPNCGNLWLAAGSHKRHHTELQEWRESGSTEPPQGAIELRLPAGAAVLWRTACWHCVGPQLGRETRKILHIGYSHRWLRPTDYSEQDPGLLERCSPLRQQLLGAVPSGEVMGEDPLFEPTSAYYRMHDADVPLKLWAEEQAAAAAAGAGSSEDAPSRPAKL